MTTPAQRKDTVMDSIAAACRMHELPEPLIKEIVTQAEASISRHGIGDPEEDRRQALKGFLEQHHPDLWQAHQEGLEQFIGELAARSSGRWEQICLSAGWMYGTFINYRDADGQVDVARSDDLIDRLEKSGLIDISYTFVEEDEDGEEGEFIEIEKSDIPPVGEPAYSPLTGELDPNFHDRIERHFMIGTPLKALFAPATP